MRAVVQRALWARVEVDGRVVASTGPGLVAFVAVESGDGVDQALRLARRLVEVRLMGDGQGRMALSLLEAGGELLLVSNLTVAGQVRKGRRLDLSRAAGFEAARQVFDELVRAARGLGARVQVGTFGAMMRVTVVNDGPVTVVVEEPAGACAAGEASGALRLDGPAPAGYNGPGARG